MQTDSVSDQLPAAPGIDLRVDHIAIAVRDLQRAIEYFEQRLGFAVEEMRETAGKSSGMRSCVMRRDTVTFVLLEGYDPESRISRFIEAYGPGVHHVALHVNGLSEVVEGMEQHGLTFSTGVARSASLLQRFTERDENSGMMIEFIERGENPGFDDGNVAQLFQDLERSEST